MNKIDAIRIIVDSAKLYEKYLANRNLLFVSLINKNTYNLLESKFLKSNYKHLAGVITPKEISADYFYEKCINNKLTIKDFEFKTDGTTQLKLEVLPHMMNIYKNSKMIGDYNGTKLKLRSNKLTGTTNACIGLLKNDNFYVPITVLKEDTRNLTISQERIIVIFSKDIKDILYNNLNYLVREFENTDRKDVPEHLLKKLDINNMKCDFHLNFIKI